MAKMNLKRSIAMLLVLNMLTGMLPIQALAEEGNTEAPEIVVTITPSEKKESAPAEKTESAPAEKQEAAPAEKTESAPAEKQESAPAETESAPAEKQESAPAETESAPAEKQESAPVETESAPAEKQESAPAETESAPAEKQESAPAETESAPAAEVVVETVVEETASYDDESGNEPEAQSETTSFEGEEPELDYDSELTYGEEIGGTVTETTETETDAEGNETVTETTEVVTNGTTEDGTKVEGKETYVESETTNANGEVTGSFWEKDGVEITDKVVAEETGDGEQPEVTVDLIPGETTESSVVTSETVVENTADGSTVTITETDRTVTAETSDAKVTVNDADTGLVEDEATEIKGLAPVYDVIDGKKEDKGGMFDYQFDSGEKSKYANPDNWDMPEGADVRYVGTGEHSKYYVATAYVVYEKDEDGNTVYDEEGKPVIKEVRRYSDENSATITIDGEPVTELPEGITLEPVYDNYGGSRPFIFMLMDKNKNKFYGYCCDLETDAGDGNYYTMSNLEDSDYYASEESEQHIRSILMNGYWGTSDIPKEDGSYEMGSMESIKQSLREAINSGEMENTVLEVPAKDENGNPVFDEAGNPVMESKTMLEMIEGLTAGEALLATQAAVWTYANGSNDVLNGKDGAIVLDPDGYKWNHNPNGNSKSGEAMDDCSSAVVDFMYTWLINLKSEEESTVIINEKNFIDDMSITVRDKDEDHDNNKDDNKDNDVYNTDLNFKLAFIPGENDDLLVQVSYTDLEGNPVNVVRRLAGENAEGQDYEGIKPEEDGSYVIKGIKLSENEEFAFDLRLEGTQYLENGVYVYAPVGGRDVSQTFVGVASGEKSVDVSVGVTIKFDVDENNHVVAERRWHSEKDPQRTERETPPPPAEYRLGFGVGQLEVIEEEVPLAAPPQTGDMSILWFAMIALSGCGLCILNLLEKRKCRA